MGKTLFSPSFHFLVFFLNQNKALRIRSVQIAKIAETECYALHIEASDVDGR